jgi:hypothetical protein
MRIVIDIGQIVDRILKMFKYSLISYKWYRKYMGGTYYYVMVPGLGIGPMWTDNFTGSCQSYIIKVNWYPDRNTRKFLKKYT